MWDRWGRAATKIASICLALLITLTTSVAYATTTFTAKLESDKLTVKAGEEVEVVLKLEDFTENEKGTNVLLGTLEYDRNIFEKIEDEDIEILQYWNSPMYNSENGKLILEANEFINTPHNVLKIKFKVKDNIEENTSTEIRVKEISGSDSQVDILTDDAVAVLQVEKANLEDSTNENTSDNKMMIVILSILGIIIVGSICIVIVKKKM